MSIFDTMLQGLCKPKRFKGFKIQLYAGSEKWIFKMKADFMKKYVNQDSPTINISTTQL